MKQWILSLSIVCAAASAAACSDDDKNENLSKSYAVGDLYAEGGVKGIVFKLDGARGRHGLIVSLDENTAALWAIESAATVRTGAIDTEDGEDNQEKIEAIAGWQTKYPAFAWCGAKNTGGVKGWYLPAFSELARLYDAYIADPEAFNLALTSNGGVAIAPTEETGNYWSSSENLITGKEAEAAAFDFFSESFSFKDKTNEARVRAIREF